MNDYATHQKLFYPNGQLKEALFYKDGLRDGKAVLYDEQGRIVGQGTYAKDCEEGLWQYYWAGVLAEEINFCQGRREGAYKEYSVSGKLCVEGQYTNKLREGVWKYYTETGELSQEIIYKDGKPIQATRYK